jgi:hypothetical protein
MLDRMNEGGKYIVNGVLCTFISKVRGLKDEYDVLCYIYDSEQDCFVDAEFLDNPVEVYKGELV